MRFLAIFLALLLPTAFFAYPPLIEQSDGECSALEQRFRDLSSHDSAGFLIIGQLYGSSSSEPNGAAYARDHYPLLPAGPGCALAYWHSLVSPPTAPATPPPPPTAQEPAPSLLPATPALPIAPAGAATIPAPAPPAPQPTLTSTLARGMTPNGDPISPGTIFTSPMPAVAIRVDYPSRAGTALRFNLMQGRAVLSSCIAQRAAPSTAWCKFNVPLRKGMYEIALTANNTLVGQF